MKNVSLLCILTLPDEEEGSVLLMSGNFFFQTFNMLIQQTIQRNYPANVKILVDMFNSVYLSSNPQKEL